MVRVAPRWRRNVDPSIFLAPGVAGSDFDPSVVSSRTLPLRDDVHAAGLGRAVSVVGTSGAAWSRRQCEDRGVRHRPSRHVEVRDGSVEKRDRPVECLAHALPT